MTHLLPSIWRPGTSAQIHDHVLGPSLLHRKQDPAIILEDTSSTSYSVANSETSASTPATSYSSSQLESDSTLKDLSKYIAIGCLHLPNSFQAHVYSFAPDSDWIELLHSHLSPSLSEALGLETVKLLHAGWIRLFVHHTGHSGTSNIGSTAVRVYLLPGDVGRRFIDRQSKNLKSAVRDLVARLDTSPEIWSGHPNPEKPQRFDPWASAENLSLFYLFNKLPSPAPSPSKIRNRFTRQAVENLLDSANPNAWQVDQSFHGLRTRLYPYQARSAALMIERESAPQLQLDPRLEVRQSPNGENFYFGPRDGSFLQEPRFYETNRGGILAETMGLGKTIICLAVILATRFHIPQTPPEYQQPPPTRERTGSLAEMVSSTIGRNAIPAKAHIKRLEEEEGIHLGLCLDVLEKYAAQYEIPVEPPRMNRTTRVPPPEKFVMCSGTIIVVPRNLLHQWQSEIRKHVDKGSLKILVVDSKARRRDTKDKTTQSIDVDDMEFRNDLPAAEELTKFDVILFSRTRFESEIQDGADQKGRRLVNGAPLTCQCPYIGASRIRDCTCLVEDGLYQSPLKKLHWLRIIIDEGHSFSSGNSNAVLVAKHIKAERRWVVSGTPAKDLVGVEVDLSTLEDASGADPSLLRELAVEQRKSFSAKDDTAGAVKSLGNLSANFLMVRPWSDSRAEGRLEWEDYIYRHEHHTKRTYAGFSLTFLRTLEGLVVKTRPEDVEKDIRLPPMNHRVVYLKPCWYDKMTANLFIQVLRANAITSERTDNDYLFHKNNQKARHRLMMNLRQSNFTWTGFRLDDIFSTIQTSLKYLEKEERSCSQEDYDMLLESTRLVGQILESSGWMALSKAHEVGLFVEEWPQASEEAFALAYPQQPAMIGITQLLEGQIHVDEQISASDPADGLKLIGEAAKAKIEAMAESEKQEAAKSDRKKESDPSDAPLTKTGVPTSCVAGEPVTTRRLSLISPKASPTKSKKSTSTENDTAIPLELKETEAPISPVRQKKRKLTLAEHMMELPESSVLRNTRAVGTTSAKLTYIIEKVIKHQSEEKILIFYDGDNAAYYIAQCLELLHVDHRIYARTLDNATRSKYVALFNEDPNIRVLLIDVACGALGLNLNVASVVLIINPINRPSIEAQAIKRAHRIGQTKEVLVETLVLEGSIEEAIFNQAKKMSRSEHLQAKTLEDDDKIQSIIQNAKVFPVEPGESNGYAQFAPLETKQQVFGRPGRAKFKRIGQDEANGQDSQEKPKKRARKPKPKAKRNDKAEVTIRSPNNVNQVDQSQDHITTSSSLFGGGLSTETFG